MIDTETLSLSELRYRRLFEAARDGILLVDPTTRKIVDVNPYLIEFLGYGYGEFIGKELFEIGLLKDEAANRAAFRELQSVGYIRYDDLPLKTKDGRRVDVGFVSNLYDEGAQQIIQCNIRDISLRKRADAALHESEERFKLVARAVSDVIWDLDLVSEHLWWSDGLGVTFGYLESEIEPNINSWIKLLHPDERHRIVDGLHQAIDTGEEMWRAEFRFLCKSGSYAIVQTNAFIIRDATGKAIRLVAGLRDLTEQKKAEEHHLRAQRMESIGTLAGGIAHDLNNMLTPIMMSIELLKLYTDNTQERSSILETIDISCRRGADLVRQVLTFARGLNGQRIALRLRTVSEELQGLMNETFPRNIKIVTQVPSDLWPITGDPTQIHQMLLNLAVNARDAMPQGGALTISAANIVLDAHHLGTSHETHIGRYVRIQVIDTGIGIPPELSERIFEPFFTTKAVGKGTGFGLATVHTIVKSHGGFISVESAVGQGTTFTVHLPADRALRVASAQPFPSNLPRGNGELVLVVDDEASIRTITQKTLETFGYKVITANDGAEAVALYTQQSQQIALVLTDMMMPVMDGATAIPLLKKINASVRIIAISGMEVPPSTRASVCDFLPKPFSAPNLLRMVHSVLERPAVAANQS